MISLKLSNDAQFSTPFSNQYPKVTGLQPVVFRQRSVRLPFFNQNPISTRWFHDNITPSRLPHTAPSKLARQP
jgi:hypothetical protein